MGSTARGMTEMGPDWRVVDGVTTAWFDAPSMISGAALARRIDELPAETVVDMRTTGIRMRLGSDEYAEAVSAAARDLGLAANPAVLQQMSVVFESENPRVVREFWQRVLDYAPGEDGGLADPLRRDPAIRIRQSTERRPLRNRIHLDVVRPAAAVEQAGVGEASGPFGVCHTDPDGNEVDLVPGSALGERIGDSRLAGGVQRDGVLPRQLALLQPARPGRRSSGVGRRHRLPSAGRPAPRARDHRQR